MATDEVVESEDEADLAPAEDDEILGEATTTIVAKIQGTALTVDELLRSLIVDRQWTVIDQCLNNKLISAHLDKHEIALSQEELREHLSAFRQRHGLLVGDDVNRWLEQNHMDVAALLEHCTFEARKQKLKELLFKDTLDQYFAHRQLELASIELYKIVVESENVAKEIILSLQEGASFFDYARRYSTDEDTKRSCGYVGNVPMHTLDPKLQQLLVGKVEGDIIGPVKVMKSIEIHFVGKVHPSQFDGATRELLLDELFNKWLADLRSRGAVETLI